MADEGKQENVTPVAPESPHVRFIWLKYEEGVVILIKNCWRKEC